VLVPCGPDFSESGYSLVCLLSAWLPSPMRSRLLRRSPARFSKTLLPPHAAAVVRLSSHQSPLFPAPDPFSIEKHPTVFLFLASPQHHSFAPLSSRWRLRPSERRVRLDRPSCFWSFSPLPFAASARSPAQRDDGRFRHGALARRVFFGYALMDFLPARFSHSIDHSSVEENPIAPTLDAFFTPS